MIRLIAEVMTPVRFGAPDEFNAHRTALNERLILSGFTLGEDGRVYRTMPAATIREAHERANALRSELSRRDVHRMSWHSVEPS